MLLALNLTLFGAYGKSAWIVNFVPQDQNNNWMNDNKQRQQRTNN